MKTIKERETTVKTMLRWSSAALLLCLGTLLAPQNAEAIPAFARKYKIGCNTCHTFYPQLNRFGRDFRDNGFRMSDEVAELLRPKSEKPPGPPAGSAALAVSHGAGSAVQNQATSSEDDFWSFIPEEIPFSVQAKVHALVNPKGDVKQDFQLEELQLQSGGTFTSRVSYFLHHHLAEEGGPGNLYVGWVRFNNLLGTNWLNLTVGQTELPLSFSPEIERLSSFGYLAFARELGANSFNLNMAQIGLQVFGQSARGTKIWAGVANGSGLAIDESTETFDNNTFKDVYARVGQEIGEHFVGGYAYYGRARARSAADVTFDNAFVRVGGDGFFDFSPVIVYGTALYARDADPLGIGERRTFVGGFVEGNVHVTDRTLLSLRLDAVRQKLPAFWHSEEEEEEEETGDEEVPLFRVNTFAITPGLRYLVRPNVKLGLEYQIRQSRREDRAIGQLHLSF